MKIGRGVVALSLVLGTSSAILAADTATTGQLYESRCAFCHGAEGRGDGIAGDALNPKPTDFTSADFWKTATPENLHDAIMNGKPGTAMVPFRMTLTADQITALVEHLKTFAPK